MKRSLLFALGSLGLFSTACAQFPSIPESACGNHVVEGNEDCDGFPNRGGSHCLEPGTAFECHLDCGMDDEKGTRNVCPDGWGCDADSICRIPSGKYFESSLSTDVGAWLLSAGDFDGDGRQDVMSREPLDATGGTRLRFNYFDESGALVETRLFPRSVASPTIDRISDGDTRSDVAFASGPIGVMNGRGDRTWVPEVFSSYRRANATVRVVGVYDRAIGGSDAFVSFISFPAGSGFYVGDPDTGTLVEHLGVPGSTEKLVGDLVSGNVFEDTKHSPCSETVFAMRETTYFSVVDACDTDEGTTVWRAQFGLTEVLLEPPARIDVAPQIVDMNGDGHLDVLLGAGGRHPYVAYGDGSVLRPATPYSYPAGDPAFPKTSPLAVADVTGDGALDFVFPDRLVVSSTAYLGAVPFYTAIGNRMTTPWTVAKIADFNANGLLDVVAASNGSLNLAFFNGTGTHNLSPSLVSTSAPVQLLSVGDFDGDLITDLALVEVPLPEQAESTLKVAFGSAFAPLDSAVEVGQIGQLEALNSYLGAGRDNLTVCSTESIDGVQNGALTLLYGGAERVPFAPLTLTDFSSSNSVQYAGAFGVASGRFVSTGQTDLLALGFFPEASLPPINVWSIPEITKTGAAPVRLPGALDPRLTPLSFTLGESGAYTPDVTSTSADFDGDGRDEAVFAMPADGGIHCGLLFLKADAQGSFGSAARVPLIIGEPCSDPQLTPVNMHEPPRESKGPRPDLALLTGQSNGSERHLWVLWNDDNGGFAAENATLVSPLEDSPQQFTVLPSAHGKDQLAYVTKNSLRLLPPPTGHEFAVPLSVPEVTLSNGTGIVAADVNGDHLLDLVFSESGKLRVLRAELEVR